MSETPAPDTGRSAEETMRADEALVLRDELMAYAAQLIRMSTQAGLGGRDLSVRVKEPEHLAHLITRAASAIQAREWAAAEAQAAHLRAENARLLERIREAEKDGEAMKPHDYEVIGTTYDGVKVLRPVSEPTNFTREEIRNAVKAALSSEPRCTATGNPCGTDTVIAGRQCPDSRWGGRCAHRIAKAAHTPKTQEAGDGR